MGSSSIVAPATLPPTLRSPSAFAFVVYFAVVGLGRLAMAVGPGGAGQVCLQCLDAGIGKNTWGRERENEETEGDEKEREKARHGWQCKIARHAVMPCQLKKCWQTWWQVRWPKNTFSKLMNQSDTPWQVHGSLIHVTLKKNLQCPLKV